MSITRILLATGIYPPAIGGPATYVRALAKELHARGNEVTVITYGGQESEKGQEGWPVIRVSGRIPIFRWFSYAGRIREYGANADVIYVFSSVSAGIPLIFSGARKPKKILRLGGDFFWERYTDLGGRKTLKEFYESGGFGSSLARYSLLVMQWLLQRFDHIVFSTRFQEVIYEKHFKQLPSHAVIENALVTSPHPPTPSPGGGRGEQFRLLFMGRFVGFKNLPNLLHAVAKLPWVTLTLIGDGPLKKKLWKLTQKLDLSSRVRFVPSVSGEEKMNAFANNDLLILPSLTEISPHVVLEARAVGLPVLLTEETGLSSELAQGMILRKLRMPEDIVKAIIEVHESYEALSQMSENSPSQRSWGQVAEEHVRLFHSF